MSKKITVKGIEIKITEREDGEYVSLTDIARQSDEDEPRFVIRNWMKNSGTLRFLWTWEKLYNPKFNSKGVQMDTFMGQATDNLRKITPEKWIKEYNAIGLISKRGRHGGGTFAHTNIALEFCSWLSPEFKVYMIKEFERLKAEESKRLNYEWHISKITDNVDEIRALLDTIPGQLEKHKRIKDFSEEE